MHLSGFSSGNFKVVRPGPRRLIVKHSRVAAVLGAALWLGLIALFYWNVLEHPETFWRALASASEKLELGGPWLFLLLVPLGMAVLALGRLIRVALVVHRIEVDADARTVRYGRRKIPFHGIQAVQFRALTGPESGPEYLLSLLLADERKIRVVSHDSRDRVLAAADDLAEMLGVGIRKVDD